MLFYVIYHSIIEVFMGEEKVSLEKVIEVKEDKCAKCFNCISVCPAKLCNIVKDNAIYIDHDKCIGCGKCVEACKIGARDYLDDFSSFMESTSNNEDIIAIVSPAATASFSGNHFHLNGWLRSLGVDGVFDISFGAELTVMSYVKYMMFNNPSFLISSTCPSIVEYIQIYRTNLVNKLAPIDSHVVHTIKMIEEYYPEISSAKVAVISPCLSRKRELNRVGLGDFNVTLKSIKKYIYNNNIDITDFPEHNFMNESPERAVTFSMPGGMTKTIERWMPDIIQKVRKISGEERVYDYLDSIENRISKGGDKFPQLMECWNCKFGCNNGPGTKNKDKTPDEYEYWIKQREKEMKEKHRQEGGGGSKDARRHVENILNNFWKEELYDRKFDSLQSNNTIEIPSQNELTEIYHKMNKYNEEDIKDCQLCGYNSCRQMAIAIYNGLNRPENCHFYLQNQYDKKSKKLEQKKGIVGRIISFLPFGIIITNMEGEILKINESAQELIGYEDKKLIEGNYSDILSCDEVKSEKSQSRGRVEEKRCKIKNNEGKQISILKSVVPIEFREKNAYLISFVDVTRMEEAERKVKEMNEKLEQKVQARTEELEKSLQKLQTAKEKAEQAKEEAQESDRLKSEFLANMSHEIRTPMNSIIGFTKILLDDIEEEENKEHLEMIYSSGKNLLSLINDILDISKIEAGKMEIDPRPFSLKKLIDQFSKMFEQRAKKKGLYFNTKIGEDVPEYVLGDDSRINQILINLAGNAIKFTEEGGILISCHYNTEKSEAVISVKDTGVGIPPEKQEKIFKPFRQADASTTRKFGELVWG